MTMLRPAVLLFVLACSTVLSDATQAQATRPRFGFGFNALVSTADGPGIGLRGRIAAPINRDLSLGLDIGATGFVLEGRRDATWVFDPQASAIITMPGRGGRALYYLTGVGAYLPINPDSDNDPYNDDPSSAGPTVHGGVGWVQRLTETTIFYEFNPAVVIAEEHLHVIFPFRAGLIF